MRKMLGMTALAASLLLPTTMASAAKTIGGVSVPFDAGLVVYEPGRGGESDVRIPEKFGTVAVTAVPEPATWGLMIIGLGSIGFAMRRRSKAVVSFG